MTRLAWTAEHLREDDLAFGRVPRTSHDTAPPKTQSGIAYDRIRRRILEWDLRPDAVLDEKDLMARLEMGRTPIREALLRLSEQGLVVVSPNRNMRVAPLDLETIRALYEVRLHNDRLAARLFMTSASKADKAAVAEIFDDGDALIDARAHRTIFDRDFAFHSGVVECAGNSFLRILHQNMSGHFFRIAFLTFYGDGPPDQDQMAALIRSHDGLVAAIRAGDAEALDAAVSRHTADSYENVIAVLTRARLIEIADMNIASLAEATEKDRS